MPSLASRRIARRPALEAKLAHMAQELQALVNTQTGIAHRDFPLTIVQFWLLTDEQLESLASFYHQRTPTPWKYCYPCPVEWPRIGLTLEDKRRKFGRFIGLRGCDTPRRPTGSGHLGRRQRWPSPAKSCRGDCRMSWDDETICMPCSMRKINKIVAGDDPSSSDNMCMDVDNVEMDTNMDTNMDDCEKASSERSYTRPESKDLTVDEIIEHAQRTRLQASASEEIMRRKTGHY
ncbi:hypothetical protein SPBR_05296 [Sporothrix brasiliensis 5110]|uniref:Uncharacterized protein n=1 Tax=Sporothrix brasiliensis 5110 TaxID=1398154 RepID=A0A0C2IS42_9PEZI|nr:uncharacterized protein SPBR_05296 [Sporothrix brasiliensis 5110]KIH87827.1 hypothetical protein SPBR_05296 [Sporothrix brasiliensis 5110]